jgi:hypothetical protein
MTFQLFGTAFPSANYKVGRVGTTFVPLAQTGSGVRRGEFHSLPPHAVANHPEQPRLLNCRGDACIADWVRTGNRTGHACFGNCRGDACIAD